MSGTPLCKGCYGSLMHSDGVPGEVMRVLGSAEARNWICAGMGGHSAYESVQGPFCFIRLSIVARLHIFDRGSQIMADVRFTNV